jgi:hypothetical protein
VDVGPTNKNNEQKMDWTFEKVLEIGFWFDVQIY